MCPEEVKAAAPKPVIAETKTQNEALLEQQQQMLERQQKLQIGMMLLGKAANTIAAGNCCNNSIFGGGCSNMGGVDPYFFSGNPTLGVAGGGNNSSGGFGSILLNVLGGVQGLLGLGMLIGGIAPSKVDKNINRNKTVTYVGNETAPKTPKEEDTEAAKEGEVKEKKFFGRMFDKAFGWLKKDDASETESTDKTEEA